MPLPNAYGFTYCPRCKTVSDKFKPCPRCGPDKRPSEDMHSRRRREIDELLNSDSRADQHEGRVMELLDE